MNYIVGGIASLLYLGIGVFVIWHVLSSLRRISRGVEEIAETLRQMNANRS